MCAEVFDLELEPLLASTTGSLRRAKRSDGVTMKSGLSVNQYLEGHVLEKVSSAIRAVRLSPRSRIDPNTNGCRLGMGLLLRGNCQTIVEDRDLGKRVRIRSCRRKRLPRQSQLVNEGPDISGSELGIFP